jgi:hypothetical protein
MSEAVLILQRARGAYASEIRICDRKLEKVEKGSDQGLALDQRRLTLEHQLADIDTALGVLNAAGLDVTHEQPDPDRPAPTGLREPTDSLAPRPSPEASDTVS